MQEQNTRCCSLPRRGGTNPLNLFCESHNPSSVVRLDIEEGMAPLNWLSSRLNSCIMGNLSPISAGMLPCSLFPPTAKFVSDDKLYKEGGITPESLLSSKLRNCRPASLPRLSGMGPWSRLRLRDTACSDDRLARDAGINPVKVVFHQ